MDEAETPAGDELDLSSLTEGLGSLSSYKSSFVMRFTGKDEQGNPVDGTWESREEFTRQPAAQRMIVDSSGFGDQAAQTGGLEIINIEGTTYMVTVDAEGVRSCSSFSSDDAAGPESGQLFSPDQLGGVSGADYVDSPTVNGVQTKHYRWSEDALGVLGFAAAKGEVWVADPGGYTVKYTAEATGKGGIFGASDWEGTFTTEYNLTEANGSFTIEPPADCKTAATDIPTMADARDKATFGEMQSYTSDSSLDAVKAFYEAEMPANGWQPGAEAMQMEGFASLNFTKEGRTAQIMITSDAEAGTTSVVVTTSEG